MVSMLWVNVQIVTSVLFMEHGQAAGYGVGSSRVAAAHLRWGRSGGVAEGDVVPWPGHQSPVPAAFHILVRVLDLLELWPGTQVKRRVLAVAVIVPVADVARRRTLLPPLLQQLADLAVVRR